ncbi:MAG TPA: glycosyltransferase family 4 protein [Chthoniobacterales bacterium]|nr:glycosyltransferase family 4 protein [Chthoniobacterales bacterium]
MCKLAYLFERFPAFTKTFCAREVAELYRQNYRVPVFSIRRPNDERPVNIPLDEVAIHYLPDSNSPFFKIPTRWAARRFADHWQKEVDSRDKHRFFEAIYLGNRLKKAGTKHLHVHFAGMAARTAWWIKKLFGISYSFTGHANDIFVEKPDQRVPLKSLVAEARFVVSVSDYGVQYLKSRFPFAANKIYRVYNGVDLAQFIPAEPTARSAHIISVGRLIPKKGYAELVEACSLLNQQELDFRCTIIGGGPEHLPLRQLITARGLDQKIELVGPKSQIEIVQSLAQSQVFVFPAQRDETGDQDNLPTVLIEAMASGLPVVSSGLAGIPEIIVDQINGILVPPETPEALASAIRSLLLDPKKRERLGASGLRTVREKFNLVATVQELIGIFESHIA